MPLLEVENLVIEDDSRPGLFRYRSGARRLIDDVSFSVEKGQCFGLVGEDGCGKFPLTFGLLRLQAITSGSIRFEGAEVTRMKEKEFLSIRRHVQALFPLDFGQLPPHFTIERGFLGVLAVHEPHMKDWDRGLRIEEALKRAGASLSIRNLHPADLCPLDRQRAALARALMIRPRLLICHDFTRGLDVAAQAALLNRLCDLREEMDLSLLFITHDLAVADHMSDPIAILSRGRIVESGSPGAIANDPQHDYTRKLVSLAPRAV